MNLENKGYDQTWGPGSPAPYLATTLRGKGLLLNQYFGVAHSSLPNYLAQVCGQAPSVQTQADCQVYSRFVGTGTVPPGQAVGQGCGYPAAVPTIGHQYARHNRFVYFSSIIDLPNCATQDVDLKKTASRPGDRCYDPRSVLHHPETCVTTDMTRPASTDNRAVWSVRTPGSSSGYPRSSSRRHSQSTVFR